jgi:hypothetical protein
MPLTIEGLEVLRAADYLTLIRSELDAELAQFGIGPIDYERDTLLGSVTAVQSIRLGDLAELLQAVYDSRDPSNAQGVQLSSIALATGITRNEATPSSVVLTLAGDPGTIIPSSRTVRGGGETGEALWDLRENATIGGGGTVDATFDAQEAGATLAPAGTTWDIVTVVLGWTGATNAADAEPGENRETDDELRIRRQESLQIGGSTSARAIRAELLEIEGIEAAAVLENDDGLDLVFDGVLITSHTIAVFVLPDTIDDATRDLVARAVYDKKAAAVRTQGTESAAVSQDGLATVTIRYSFAVDIPVTFDITIKIDTTSPDPPTFADLEADILADLATRYTPTLGLGVDGLIIDVLCIVTTTSTGVKRVGVRSASVVITAPTLDGDGNAVINAFERIEPPTYNVIDGT